MGEPRGKAAAGDKPARRKSRSPAARRRPARSRTRSRSQTAAQRKTEELYYYDAAAGDAAVRWIEHYCVFVEDRWAGKPFKLEGWQADEIIRPLFGWKRRRDGTRRYRRVIVWVPRKNGKSELAATVSLAALIGTGVVGGQVYSIGRDKDQAKIVFEKASRMVSLSPALGQHVDVLKTSLFCPQLMASYKPLSGVPEGKHGLSASALIGDEAHEWRDGRLYTYLHQSEGNRTEPIEFLISTAGLRQGYGWELWQESERIRDGLIEDSETLVVIYAASEDDDWTKEATWRKANPNLDVSLSLEYLRAECKKAMESPRVENDFKRYHLNLWTEQAVRWLPLRSWDAAGGADRNRWREVAEQLQGRRCYGGLDLASTTDINALVWVFPDEDDAEAAPTLLARFWVPKETMELRQKRDRVPYDRWVRERAMFATPGNVADYRAIKKQIEADCEAFKVEGLAIDRWNATQLAVELGEEDVPVELFGQGFASMSAPSKRFEELVVGKRIDHGHHPVLRWMVGNAAVATDAADNIKPAKDKSTDRIDGVVAAVMGLGLLAKAERKTRPVGYQPGEMFLS